MAKNSNVLTLEDITKLKKDYAACGLVPGYYSVEHKLNNGWFVVKDEENGIVHQDINKIYSDLHNELKNIKGEAETENVKKAFCERTEKIISTMVKKSFIPSFTKLDHGNRLVTMIHAETKQKLDLCVVDENRLPVGLADDYFQIENLIEKNDFRTLAGKIPNAELSKNGLVDFFDPDLIWENDRAYEKTFPYPLRNNRIFCGWKLQWNESSQVREVERTNFDGEVEKTVVKIGKWAKVPVNAITGFNASTTDKKTWCSWDEAVEGIKKHNLSGLGVMLGNGLSGIDIDKVRGSNGELTEEAKDTIDRVNSFTEYSVSGTGIHILIFGKRDEKYKNKNGNFEIYDEKRFFTVSGHVVDGRIKIAKKQDTIEPFIYVQDKYLGLRNQPSGPAKDNQTVSSGTSPLLVFDESKENSFGLSDKEIYDKLMRQGEREKNKYNKLYNPFDILFNKGNPRDYPTEFHPEGDPSNADIALAGMILYYTDSLAQCERIMRQSALNREKWDSVRNNETYLTQTIRRAYDNKTRFYTPKPIKQKSNDNDNVM